MEETSFHPSHIPPAVLSLPAKEVLNYNKVKDDLSFQLNMKGALKNWENVACSLGYSIEQIRGYFIHDTKPGWLLLQDWIYESSGVLKRLVDVLAEHQLNASLELIQEDVRDYLARKKQEKSGGDSGTFSSGCVCVEDDEEIDKGRLKKETDKGNCSSASSSESKNSELSRCTGNSDVDQRDKTSPNKNSRCDNASQLLRIESWEPSYEPSPIRTYRRSKSQLSERDSNGHCMGQKKKKKSWRHRVARFYQSMKRPKREKGGTKINTLDGTKISGDQRESVTECKKECSEPFKVVTASGVYSEPKENENANLSPLDDPDDGKQSLTDSLSSRDSVPSPASPGNDSGFFLFEVPSVSQEKSISIIHCFDDERDEFKEQVVELYNTFSSLGYTCSLDKVELMKLAGNKYRYAMKQVKQSDFVFICVSPALKRIFEASPEEINEDDNAVLRLQSDLILAELAEFSLNKNGRFMNIIMKGATRSDVPSFLQSYLLYFWPSQERKIRCMIEGKPEFVAAPVSNIKNDPPSRVIRPAELL